MQAGLLRKKLFFNAALKFDRQERAGASLIEVTKVEGQNRGHGSFLTFLPVRSEEKLQIAPLRFASVLMKALAGVPPSSLLHCRQGDRGSRIPHLAKNARYGAPIDLWQGEIPRAQRSFHP
jgi:hypothetical protein